MKKTILFLSSLMLTAGVNAQDSKSTKNAVDYNQWSLEFDGGFNKPIRTMSSGYSTATLNLFQVDLGGRYMFSPKFGLKLDFGFNQFQERDNTAEFHSQYLRTSLQGVVNVGRALNFETWTNTIGLLVHGGFGVSQLTSDGFEGEDYMANGILGMTGQVKLSNRVALTGDLSGIINARQNYNFDGMSKVATGTLDGVLLNASVGLTVYLGKNSKHADWVSDSDKYTLLEERVTIVETGLIDSDKDGVADLYDLEENTVLGVAVNTKGQTIDKNKNGIADDIEVYLQNTNVEKIPTNNPIEIKNLINEGYVNVYFDFNSSEPIGSSLAGVDFLIKYLRNNASAKAQLTGYADEVGNSEYNTKLSKARAESVKNIVVNSGIDASRLTVKGDGEDTSVNIKSAQARQIVRRVTFNVSN